MVSPPLRHGHKVSKFARSDHKRLICQPQIWRWRISLGAEWCERGTISTKQSQCHLDSHRGPSAINRLEANIAVLMILALLGLVVRVLVVPGLRGPRNAPFYALHTVILNFFEPLLLNAGLIKHRS